MRLDAVEIKVDVAAEGIKAAVEAFDLAHKRGIAQNHLLLRGHFRPGGSADLPLLRQGLILRLRKNRGRRDDVTAKLGPCVDSQLTRGGSTRTRMITGNSESKVTGQARASSPRPRSKPRLRTASSTPPWRNAERFFPWHPATTRYDRGQVLSKKAFSGRGHV
jgi:hypothetical protein